MTVTCYINFITSFIGIFVNKGFYMVGILFPILVLSVIIAIVMSSAVNLELEKYQILETSFKTLRDFFKSSVYQEKFPSDYVKFLEIRAYTTLVKEKKLSESEISKLSFDNYGKYAAKIERIVRFLMQDSPVDYDAVKKGPLQK